MIKLIYAHNGETIKRLQVTIAEYYKDAFGVDTRGARVSWDAIDYAPFKKWLCDKYHFVYDAIEWRVI